MLVIAWCTSILCSLPQVSKISQFQFLDLQLEYFLSLLIDNCQAFLFHLEEHPKVHGYYQCVTFHSFRSTFHNLLYNVANMCAMYACPLITFIYCYGAIYLEIYRKAKPQLSSKGIGKLNYKILPLNQMPINYSNKFSRTLSSFQR